MSSRTATNIQPRPLAARPLAAAPPSASPIAIASKSRATFAKSKQAAPLAPVSAPIAVSPASASSSGSGSSDSTTTAPRTPASETSAGRTLDAKGKQKEGVHVQPSKEWVLPARAKPGRKPSEAEPPTKRKAQNRASQRAFRERKQSYVAGLEAKIAAYEAEEVQRSVELQKIAKRLKEENDVLRNENQAIKDKFEKLQATLQQQQSTASSSSHQLGAQLGCRAPMHEARSTQRPKRPLPTRSDSKVGASNAGPPSASRATPQGASPSTTGPPGPSEDDVQAQHQQSTSSPHNGSSTVPPSMAIQTSSFHAMSLDSPDPRRTSTSTATPSAQVAPASTASRQQSCQGRASRTTLTVLAKAPALGHGRPDQSAPLSPPLYTSVNDHDVDMDRDCGFCTESSPCVCRGEAVLRLDGNDEGDGSTLGGNMQGAASGTPATDVSTSFDNVQIKVERSARWPASDSPDRNTSLLDNPPPPQAAVPLPRRRKDQPVPAQMSVSVTSLLSSAPVARTKVKLWPTQPVGTAATTSASLPDQASVQVCPTMTRPSAQHRVQLTRAGRPKLWPTVPAAVLSAPPMASPTSLSSYRGQRLVVPAASPPCTGDPRTCSACSSDPGLAAFCEAVSNNVEDPRTSWAGPSGSAISLASHRQASHAGGVDPIRRQSQPSLLQLRSHEHSSAPVPVGWRCETIPDAWRQISSHPRFRQWDGGLDLLADVVSRRSSRPQHLAPGQTGEREGMPSVEIESTRSALAGGPESGDRATVTLDRPSASDKATTPVSPRPSLVPFHTLQQSAAALASASAHRPPHARTMLHSQPDSTLIHQSSENDQQGSADNMDVDDAGVEDADASRGPKRRRLYVESEAVQDALALLDRGMPARDRACPCPWYRPDGPSANQN